MSRYAGLLFLPCAAASLAPAQSPAASLSYIVTRIATNSQAFGINNFGQIVGNNSSNSAFLWTPAAANSTVGSLIALEGLPVAGLTRSTATAINDRGQVVGSINATPYAQPFLWSPDTPNGTSGTMIAFAGSSAATADFNARGINAYGQIFGYGQGLGYLWTPLVPNGTAGTSVTDTRFNGAVSIDDLGQVLINGTSYPNSILRFTPSASNSTVGTFVQLSGLPAAVAETAIAFNNAGTVLGMTCPAPGTLSCYDFLWTPASRDGIEGSVTAIPGTKPMTSSALNASGQVIGLQSSPDGPMPFLYTSGTMYDLTALGSELKNGGPVAINDLGQIIVDAADNNVYLLTPGTLPAPPASNEVPVTIGANVPGSGFTVSGAGCRAGSYTTPQILGWIPGSICTVAFLSPQSSEVGTRYVFDAWQDGSGSNPRNITAPAQASTYTAIVTTQYQVSARPNVPGFGSVSGGGWYTAGDRATLTATPVSGFRLVDWTGAPGPSPGVATITLTVSAALEILANFAPPTAGPPGSYVVTQIAASVLAPSIFDDFSVGKPINDFGQVITSQSGSNPSVRLWTPSAANGANGSTVDLAAGGAYEAVGINNPGQVVGLMTGSPYYLQAFLWTPAAPNGTTGAIVPFLGSIGLNRGSNALAINGPGQIVGNTALSPMVSPGSYLWTPSSANGTTGALHTDELLERIVGINDFGQVISTFPASTLFTPSSPNGESGSYTQIPEIGTPYAINNSGAVLGNGCPVVLATCKPSGWLWSPFTPHGTIGAATQIPLPPGFDSLQGTDLNSDGEVVGILTLADGTVTPFLYARGVVYDLSALSSGLRGGIPAGINDCGQIVMNTGNGSPSVNTSTGRPSIDAPGTVYLLTPAMLLAGSGHRKVRCGRDEIRHAFRE